MLLIKPPSSFCCCPFYGAGFVVVVDSLFFVAILVCGSFGFGSSLVKQCLMSFLVLQSSHWGRESWLLSCCHLAVSFLVSSSWCHGLVCTLPPHTHLLFHMVHLIIMSVLGKIFQINSLQLATIQP